MSIKYKLIALLLFINSSIFAYTPEMLSEQNDFPQYRSILDFTYRAQSTYLQVEQMDLDLIDDYITLNDSLVDEDYNKIRGMGYLFRAINISLINNKLPEDYLVKIRKLAITVYNYDHKLVREVIGHGFITNLKELIWLIELRGIGDQNIFIDNLQQSMNEDSDNKIILTILIQKNMFQQIQNWFKAKDIKQYDLLIKLMKRRSIIEKSFLKNISPEVVLKTDYIQLIDEVFNAFQSKSDQYMKLLYQHNDWLFMQMNKYKNDSKTKDLLKTLNGDWLSYNKSVLNRIIGKDQERNLRSIYGRLDIMWKTEEILYDKIGFSGHDSQYIQKSIKFINEKLNIMKSLTR